MSDKLREAIKDAITTLDQMCDGTNWPDTAQQGEGFKAYTEACGIAETLADELRAALAQPQSDVEATPVAWQYRYRRNGGAWTIWGDYHSALSSYSDFEEERRPLYTAPPPPARMREALKYIVRQQWDENADLDDIFQTAEKALRAGDNHASDGNESEDTARAFIRQAIGLPLERVRSEAARMGFALVPNDREALARIIDPNAGWGIQLDGDYFDLREAQAEYEGLQRRALIKADSIIALRGGE